MTEIMVNTMVLALRRYLKYLRVGCIFLWHTTSLTTTVYSMKRNHVPHWQAESVVLFHGICWFVEYAVIWSFFLLCKFSIRLPSEKRWNIWTKSTFQSMTTQQKNSSSLVTVKYTAEGRPTQYKKPSSTLWVVFIGGLETHPSVSYFMNPAKHLIQKCAICTQAWVLASNPWPVFSMNRNIKHLKSWWKNQPCRNHTFPRTVQYSFK